MIYITHILFIQMDKRILLFSLDLVISRSYFCLGTFFTVNLFVRALAYDPNGHFQFRRALT